MPADAGAQPGAKPETPASPQPASAGAAATQPQPDTAAADAEADGALIERLTAQGLENVMVRRSGKELEVAYENRRYRWQVTGLGVVLAAAAEDAPEGTELIVTPKMWGVPEIQVRVSAEDYRRFLNDQLTAAELQSRMAITYGRGGAPSAGANQSFRRTDLTAGLGYRASLSDEDPNEGIYGRFLAGLEGALLPGIGVTGQETIPFSKDPTKLTQARLGGVLHPAGSVFLALSGGRLTEDMDAVQAEAAWVPPSGRWNARLTLATGRDSFLAQNAQSALMTLTGWIGHRDISLSVVAGQFWDGDRGAELYLQSGFRERRFLVGGGRSGGVTRTRFQVVLPLGPRVQPEPRIVRFMIRDTINARYRAPRGLITTASVGGVAPPSLLDERQMEFSPEIVRTYLKELRRSADLLQ
jgi:hypothetical protein